MAYATDKKPGELTALTSLATDDVFVVGDTSDASEVAKYITKANLITDLTTSFAPALGADDNYVTDAEKAALSTHVVGPASATDNAIARFDGTTGKLVQNSGVTIDDTNIVTITNSTESGAVTALVVSGDRTTPTNNDEVIIELKLSDSAGNQDTVAAIRAQITDITSTSEDSQLKFGVLANGTLATRVTLNATQLYPHTDDSVSLGNAATNRFSDLFLASGGVINFNNGNATLTHSAGLLTSNVPLSLGTANALTAGTYELGHASDTTLSRVSAGVVAVEGVTVLTTATGLPLAGGTMAGNITLAENASISLDPAGSADGKYSGITVAGTAGAALAFGDLCYLDPTDSRWELADANAAAAADGDARGILGICVLAAADDASATTMLLHGIVRADTAFPALTIGAPVYVSETAGDIVVTQPTTTDVVIRIVGIAVTADEIFFNPDNTWTTHT